MLKNVNVERLKMAPESSAERLDKETVSNLTGSEVLEVLTYSPWLIRNTNVPLRKLTVNQRLRLLLIYPDWINTLNTSDFSKVDVDFLLKYQPQLCDALPLFK